MAKTAAASISVNVSGDGLSLTQGQVSSNTNAAPPSSLTTASGDNTVTVPTAFTVQGVTLTPPLLSSVQKKLKGAAGDTGILIAMAFPSSLALASGVASFIVNANGVETLSLVWW